MEPIGDQLNIDTPELVAIELPLAGIGSRFIAILVDYLIWGFVFLILGLLAAIIVPALHFFGGVSANWAIGIALLIVFLLQWGYFALFEAFGNGRTPGKRVANIRVIHQSGRGINFVEALARNLVRFVDCLPELLCDWHRRHVSEQAHSAPGRHGCGDARGSRPRNRFAELGREHLAHDYGANDGGGAAERFFWVFSNRCRPVGWSAAPARGVACAGTGEIVSIRSRSA